MAEEKIQHDPLWSIFVVLGILGILSSFLWLGGFPFAIVSLLLFWVAYRFNKNKRLHKTDWTIIIIWLIFLGLSIYLDYWTRAFVISHS